MIINGKNKHCKKSDMEIAQKFAEGNERIVFLDYYLTHNIYETTQHFNLSKEVMRLVRNLYNIKELPPRRKPERKDKTKKHVYNNGIVEKHIREGDAIPDGFNLGRLPRSKETCLKISNSKKGTISHNKGKLVYTNGINSIYLSMGEMAPEGFVRGSNYLGSKAYHNKEGRVKYFKNGEDTTGWELGEIPNQLKSINSVKSRLKNSEIFEKNNNCTRKSKLEKEFGESWSRCERFYKSLDKIKEGNVWYIYNYEIEKIKNFKTNSSETVSYIISEFEKENNCTCLNNLILKYGQLHYFNELPRIRHKKYVFISNEYLPQIDERYKNIKKPISNYEKEIVSYIKSIYIGEVRENVKDVIHNPNSNYGLELDIYIPDKKLAIEFNGVYWHSDQCDTPKNYHENKSKLCESKGIRLIHIYQDEWKVKKDKLKLMLSIALGCVKTKIYARECTIQKITNEDAKALNDAVHLQGHRNAQVTYGLYYKNELVQLMSFSKSKYNKNLKEETTWEIIRGCPGSNNIVVGGVSKLFKHFVDDYCPKSVFSYCDFNKFDGKSYEKLGMKFIGYTGPDKNWIINGNLIPRNPSKYKEYKQEAQGILWGSGSKKYLWENPNCVKEEKDENYFNKESSA